MKSIEDLYKDLNEFEESLVLNEENLEINEDGLNKIDETLNRIISEVKAIKLRVYQRLTAEQYGYDIKVENSELLVRVLENWIPYKISKYEGYLIVPSKFKVGTRIYDDKVESEKVIIEKDGQKHMVWHGLISEQPIKEDEYFYGYIMQEVD